MPNSKAEVKEKFAHEEYPIHVVGRHIDVTEPMKAYAVEKLTKVERFGGRVVEATIAMDIQKLVHSVSFIINVNNTKIKVSGKSEDMYKSVDLAIAHLETKLRRYTERLHDHYKKGHNHTPMAVSILETPLDEINDQIEEENLQEMERTISPAKVVAKKTRLLKMLTQEEAIMKIELSDDVFLIYLCEEDQKQKVLYRRKDGNYGLIELE